VGDPYWLHREKRYRGAEERGRWQVQVVLAKAGLVNGYWEAVMFKFKAVMDIWRCML
jgi:hypothetical protein